MFECPIVYYEKNLIFDNTNSCWGVFKLNGYDYDNLSEESKLEIHHKLTRMFSTIIDESKTLVVPSAFDLDTHYKNFENSLDEDDVLYNYAFGHSRATKQYLKDKGQEDGTTANDYETYITVKLVTESEAGSSSGAHGIFEALIKDPVNAIETLMHTREKDVMESKIKHVEKLADRFFAEQDKRIKMRPATSTEIQYLLKRSTYKGIEYDIKLNLTRKLVADEHGNQQEILSDWTPYAERSMSKSGKDVVLRPYFRDIINLFQGEIDQRENRMLKITHNNGAVSYQTYLVFAHIPFEQDYPGNEWLYLLQNLNVQAEVCIHTKNTEHRQALRELELQTRKIKSQYENISEVSEDAGEVIKSYQQAKELEAEIKTERSPIVETCISICLFGKTPEEVEAKAEFVRSTYSDLSFVLERPVSDQFKLFMQHIIGTGKYIDTFTMPLLPQTLAGGVIGVNNQLGDNVGPYIGTTGKLNKPVFLDMGLACRVNDSASATIFGKKGRGKSFLADLLGCLNVFYGGYTLIFDPQGERSEWKEKLPMLKDVMNIVTLGPGKENRGKLDPFLVYADDFASASELALVVISELYKLKPNGEESLVLTFAIEELRDVEKPCMLKLCEVLENSKQETRELKKAAFMLAKRLRSTQSRGIAALIFGTGEEKAISLKDRMNILQIQNLKMPSPETSKEQYTTEETLSMVMMLILGNIAKKFMLIKRNVTSEIIFDESYMLGKTSEGKNLYDFLARSGRKYNCCCIFNGHSVLDIATEGIRNSITYKFCFYTNNNAEAERVLDYLEMEKTPDNMQLIKDLGNGECLFRDMYERVGVLKVDAVFDDIIEAFNTTPKTKQEAAAAAETQEADLSEEQADEIVPDTIFAFDDMFVREVVG